MLTRMRAVAGLIGIASGFADSAHISVAGWLIEGLADEALERLTDAIRWAALRQEFGSDDQIRAWLNAPHPDLGGEPPLALLTRGSATALADYVRSALAGQPT